MIKSGKTSSTAQVTAGQEQSIPEAANSPILEWSAPLRVFKPLNRDNFKRLVVWCLLLGIVLIFFKEFVLALAVFSLLFFSYVMGTVPPQVIQHRISENGITTAGHTYLWRELRDFYFTEKLGQMILNVETSVRPTRLSLILQSVERNQVEGILSRFVPHREESPRSFFEVVTEKAAEILNLA